MAQTTKFILFLLIAVIAIFAVTFFSSKNKNYTYEEPVNAPTSTVTATSTPVSTTETSTSPITPASPSFSLNDISSHNNSQSCWSAINGKIYDLTTFIDKHPGGAKNILKICGKDGSIAFDAKHGGDPKQLAMLPAFEIGLLK